MMCKRIPFIALIFLLVFSAAPLALADRNCDFSISNYARAVQLHDMGDYDRALWHYDCALEEDPSNTIIPLLIENLHEDIANAQSAWSAEAPAASCDAALDHAQRATAAYAAGDYDRAQSHLSCALLVDPTDVPALRLMGQLHLDRGDTRSARHYLDRAEAAEAPLEAGPTELEWPEWLAPDVIVPSAKAQAAAPPPSPPFLRQPDMPPARQPLVIISEHTRVLVQTEQVLIISDGDTLTYWRRLQKLYIEEIKLFISSGQMTLSLYERRVFAMSLEARLTWRAVERPAPEQPAPPETAPAPPSAPAAASPAQASYQHGLQMLTARKLYAAATSFIEALDIDPTHRDARCQLGIVFTEWANYGSALAHFDRLLAEDAQDACASEHRKNAILDMLAMFVPLTVDDFFYHGRAYVSVGELARARDVYVKGLELDPWRNDARCALGLIYQEMGDVTAARREFARLGTSCRH